MPVLKNAPSIEVKVKYLSSLLSGNEPEYATDGSAGIDLPACFEEDSLLIAAGDRVAVPTGLAIEIMTPGVAGFLFSRSGLGAKDGLTVSQGVGVIDPDYRGEIIVSLLNTSNETREIFRGQRIAQLIFMPFHMARLIKVDELSDTSRGAGGFGHTGKV